MESRGIRIAITLFIFFVCGYTLYPSIEWYFLMDEEERRKSNKSAGELLKDRERYYEKVEEIRSMVPYRKRRIREGGEKGGEVIFNIRDIKTIQIDEERLGEVSRAIFFKDLGEVGSEGERKELKVKEEEAKKKAGIFRQKVLELKGLEEDFERHQDFKRKMKGIVKLGLDLAGGTYLTVAVDKRDLIRRVRKYYEVRGIEDRNRIEDEEAGEIDVGLIEVDEKRFKEYLKEEEGLEEMEIVEELEERKQELIQDYESRLKLDIESATSSTLEMIRNRIDKFGVSEPKITRGLGDTIFIELPQLRKGNIETTIKTITDAGQMNFYLVDEEQMRKVPLRFLNQSGDYRGYISKEYLVKKEIEGSGESRIDFLNAEIAEDFKGRGIEIGEGAKNSSFYGVEGGDEFGNYTIEGYVILKNKVEVEGKHLIDARIGYDEKGFPAVSFELNQAGGNQFSKTTRENLRKRLAIVLDERVKSMPLMTVELSTQGQITWGNAQIDEVKRLVTILKVGVLPAKLDLVSKMTIGPSLGEENIRFGLTGMGVGLILVIGFMIFYYKLGGVFAVFGLFCNLYLLFSILSGFGFTLTLPGIAGIILTIGIAIDANVIIFERMREEERNSRTKSREYIIRNGYQKGFSAIFDSNITTILAALILSQIGTGVVKGFGFTLMWGIMSSLFTSLFVTRLMFDVFGHLFKLKKVYI